MAKTNGESAVSRFGNDYGMFFVLVLLIIGFSLATIEPQYPKGAEAGRSVADRLVERLGSDVNVLVVVGDKSGDPEFSTAAVEQLKALGATVLAAAKGSPVNAGDAIKAIAKRGETIDAVAASESSAMWLVLEKVSAVVSPEPSHWWPIFLKTSNLLGLANQTAVYAIIAIGMTMIIVTGGIDLSVGSMIALGSVTTALVIRDLGSGADTGAAIVMLAFLAGIAVCSAVGMFNGVMVTAFGLPPFIVTLSMMLMARGLALRLVNAESISNMPPALRWLGSERTIGVPNAVWLMILLYAMAHIVMSRTVFGRYVYAIGGNEEAARLSGVPVKRVQLAVYSICGALTGMAGIVLTGKFNSGDPKIGLEFELDVIAAVVVGGTSLMGGRGKILGTLIGAFIIAVIKKGMNLTDIQSFDQKIVLGAVILAAVLIDTLKRRGGSK